MLEPYPSSVHHPIHTTMQTLAHLSPSASSSATLTQLPVSLSAGQRRRSSTLPLPPTSESSCPRSACVGPARQASASSTSFWCNDVDRFERQTTSSPTLAARVGCMVRPNLACKRRLSEADMILARCRKKSVRMAVAHARRKRRWGLPSSLSTRRSSIASNASLVAPWRAARQHQRRQRQLTPDSSIHANEDASGCARTPALITAEHNNSTRTEVLPELRLLSATRTAPIGWSHFSGAAAFKPHMVETYDELHAKRTPEQQRFWPIIDHQLDHTGARMLSLCNPSPYALAGKSAQDEEQRTLPKAAAPLSRCSMHAFATDSQAMAFSDEDHSPLTPEAPLERSQRSSTCRVSRWARNVVNTQVQRHTHLSPSATLSAVIDFTRAQASHKHELQHAVDTPPQSPARNAYGQLIHSPPSPHSDYVCKPQLAPHAPLRIAPRQPASSASQSNDYFGHWEFYLCRFGKESTF